MSIIRSVILVIFLCLSLCWHSIAIIRESNNFESFSEWCIRGDCRWGHMVTGKGSLTFNDKLIVRTKVGTVTIRQVEASETCALGTPVIVRPFKYYGDKLIGIVDEHFLGIGELSAIRISEYERKDLCLGDDYVTGWKLVGSEISNFAKALTNLRGPEFTFNEQVAYFDNSCTTTKTLYLTTKRECDVLLHSYNVCPYKWVIVIGTPSNECVHRVKYEVSYNGMKAIISFDMEERKVVDLGRLIIGLRIDSIISSKSKLIGVVKDSFNCSNHCIGYEFEDMREFHGMETIFPHYELGSSCYDGFKSGINFLHRESICMELDNYLHRLGITSQKSKRYISLRFKDQSYNLRDDYDVLCPNSNDPIRNKFKPIHCHGVYGDIVNEEVQTRISYSVFLATKNVSSVLDENSNFGLPSRNEIVIHNCTSHQTDGITKICYTLRSIGSQKIFILVDYTMDVALYHSHIDGDYCHEMSYMGVYGFKLVGNKTTKMQCDYINRNRILGFGQDQNSINEGVVMQKTNFFDNLSNVWDFFVTHYQMILFLSLGGIGVVLVICLLPGVCTIVASLNSCLTCCGKKLKCSSKTTQSPTRNRPEIIVMHDMPPRSNRVHFSDLDEPNDRIQNTTFSAERSFESPPHSPFNPFLEPPVLPPRPVRQPPILRHSDDTFEERRSRSSTRSSLGRSLEQLFVVTGIKRLFG